MHKITVPDDVALKHPLTKEPLLDEATKKPIVRAFKEYAFGMWLNDARVGAKPVDLLSWSKVVAKFDAITGPGFELFLQDAEQAKLVSFVDDPGSALPPLIAMQLSSFSQAVKDAKQVPDAPVVPQLAE